MAPPAPIIAFLATWGAILIEYAGYVAYYKLTTTEPDMKFGDSAPFITFTVLGGLGGFVSGLAALTATFIFDERHSKTVRPTHVLKVSAIASLPFSVGAWYAGGWSPLPIFGTLATWFIVCAVMFFAILYVSRGQHSDA
jgi:hypothetical protein